MTAPAQEKPASWTDAKRIAGVRKWHGLWEVLSKEATEVMLRALPDPRGLHVLDIACGSGEPALSFARLVGAEGHVTATDLGGEILAVAEENSRRLGLTNISFRTADAQKLPFPDESFDAVTCRYGVMFFPDPTAALRECARVLKPQGRVVFLAWGPPEQPYFASTIGMLGKYADVPLNTPDAPLPFRFARPGSLRRTLEEAGFVQVQEEARTVTLQYPGTPEILWQYFRETSTVYRPCFDRLAADALVKLTSDALAALRQYYDGRQMKMPAQVVLATGMRG